MRAIFCIHVLATIASAFVVRSGTILSNQLIEVLIAIPLLLTIIVFPISMLIAAIVSLRKTLFVRGLAVVGDVVLSAIQLFFWFPTWQ